MNSGNSPTGLATGPRLGPEQIRFERTAGDLVRAILADGTRHEPVDFERRLRTHAPANAITSKEPHAASRHSVCRHAPSAQSLVEHGLPDGDFEGCKGCGGSRLQGCHVLRSCHG